MNNPFGATRAGSLALTLGSFSLTLALVSCGGSDRPTAPSPVTVATPPPAQVTVADGATGVPVTGATVTHQGQAFVTDARGVATLATASALGTPVDVTAQGFLDRKTTASASTVFLWPKVLSSTAGEAFTARLAYTSTVAGAIAGDAPLRRIVSGFSTVYVYLPPEIRTEDIRRTAEAAVVAVNAATQGSPAYQLVLEKPAGTQVVFEIGIDGTPATCDNAIAFFRTTLVSSSNSSELFGGLVNFCEARWARDLSVMAHELGHSLGLYHSDRTFDLMYPFTNREPQFSGEERLLINLTRLRRGGNRFPDTDRDRVASASSRAEGEALIVCSKPR